MGKPGTTQTILIHCLELNRAFPDNYAGRVVFDFPVDGHIYELYLLHSVYYKVYDVRSLKSTAGKKNHLI